MRLKTLLIVKLVLLLKLHHLLLLGQFSNIRFAKIFEIFVYDESVLVVVSVDAAENEIAPFV